MGFYKTRVNEVRDEGTEAFYNGVSRKFNPYSSNTTLAEAWIEGWDYGSDMAEMSNAKEAELEAMVRYYNTAG